MNKISLGITGSSGFIATAFINKFQNVNYNIFKILRKVNNSQWAFNLDSRLKGSTILYTSDQSNIKKCEEEGQKGLTQALLNLESILDLEPSKIIYLSSSLVYKRDHENSNFTEESEVEHANWYQRRKIESEKIIYEYEEGVIARMANVYGKENLKKNIFGDIKVQINTNSDSHVNIRNLNPVRDYVYIDDILVALEILICNPSQGIYNLGSGIGTSVEEIISLFGKHTRSNIKSINCANKRLDLSEIIINSKKIDQEFGWKNTISISEGIKKILQD